MNNFKNIFEEILEEGCYDKFIYKAIFVCGAPGSGKSTISKKLGLDHIGLKLLDVDETVRLLHKMNPSKHPEMKRPEANAFTEKRLSMWAREHLGLQIQTTGRRETSILRLRQVLEKNFYQTFMLFVEVDENIAQRRISDRPSQSIVSADMGRRVTQKYFRRTYPAVSYNLPLYKVAFGNNISVVTNNERPEDETSLDDARKNINQFLSTEISSEAAKLIGDIHRAPVSMPIVRKNLRDRRSF